MSQSLGQRSGGDEHGYSKNCIPYRYSNIAQRCHLRNVVLPDFMRAHQKRSSPVTSPKPGVDFLNLLSVELILEIGQQLDQVSTQAMRMTSRSLRRIFRQDGQTLVPSPSDVLKLERWARESLWSKALAFEATHSGLNRRCCSVCLDRHPRRCFSTEQLLKPGNERKCIGTESRLEVCPHVMYTLEELVYKRRFARGRAPFRLPIASCNDPQCEAIRPSLSENIFRDEVRLEYTMEIPENPSAWKRLSDPLNIDEDQASKVPWLCPHTKADDPRIIDTYKGMLLRPTRLDSRRFKCAHAGCPLRFTYNLRRFGQTEPVTLHVQRSVLYKRMRIHSCLYKANPNFDMLRGNATNPQWCLSISVPGQSHLSKKLWVKSGRDCRKNFSNGISQSPYEANDDPLLNDVPTRFRWNARLRSPLNDQQARLDDPITAERYRYVDEVNSDCDDSDSGTFMADSDEELEGGSSGANGFEEETMYDDRFHKAWSREFAPW